MISCEKDGPYIGFSHCPVCSAKYATEMGQTIRKLETALAASQAEVKAAHDDARMWQSAHGEQGHELAKELADMRTALAAMTAERDEARKSGCFFCQDCDAVRCCPEIISKLRKIAEQSGKRQWWNVMVYIIEINGLALSYLREAVNANPIARAAVEGEI